MSDIFNQHMIKARQAANEIRKALDYLRGEAETAGLDGLAEAIGEAIIAAEGDSGRGGRLYS